MVAPIRRVFVFGVALAAAARRFEEEILKKIKKFSKKYLKTLDKFSRKWYNISTKEREVKTMSVINFINKHNEIAFWNIFRFNEEAQRYDLIEKAELMAEELVGEIFLHALGQGMVSCSVYIGGNS
jgi:hypothetical protein